MAKNYKLDKKINDILLGALRMVNGYSDEAGPDAAKLEETLSAFQDIVSHLEARGFRLFKKVWRQRILEASSAILEGSDYYRCYKQHTVPDITTWTLETAYAEGDCIYPSVYDGYYYEAQDIGTSGATEPGFTAIQHDVITDGDIEWKAIADTRPGLGVNYKAFWYLDSTLTSGAAYAVNTTYRSAGDFSLQDDELYITEAYIQGPNKEQDDVDIVDAIFYAGVSRKYETGDSSMLYVEQLDIYDRMGHLFPIPKTVGANGDILHYEVVLKTADQTDSTEATGFIDSYFRFLKFCLTSDIAPENGIDWEQNIYLDKKADKLFQELKSIGAPKTTHRRLKSCYSRR